MPPAKKLVPDPYHLASRKIYCVNLDGVRVPLGRDPVLADQLYRRLMAARLEGRPLPLPGLAAPAWPSVAEGLEAFARSGPANVERFLIAAEACCTLFGREPTSAFDQSSLLAVRSHLLTRSGLKVPGGRCGQAVAELLRPGPKVGADLNAVLLARGFSQSAVDKARKLLGVERFRAGGVYMARLPAGFDLPAGGPGLSRKYVNQLVGTVQLAFDWMALHKLCPPDRPALLRLVKPLKMGKGGQETGVVPPVPDASIDATLPELSERHAAMVRLQRLTGMRPGELCALRPADVSRSPDAPVRVPVGRGRTVALAAACVGGVTVWAYVPHSHKTLYKGKPRMVPLGPDAQSVLLPFLSGPPDRPAFGCSVDAYSGAVLRAAARAGVPHWTPAMIRHTAATDAATSCDADHAAALLGHATPDMTAVYVLHTFAKAAAAALRVGPGKAG